jgi:hypothetical protein
VDVELDVSAEPRGGLAVAAEWRLLDGLAGVWLAVQFIVTTIPGRLVGATLALCTVASFLDLGVSYETRAFVGAALAVAASVFSEFVFGAFIRLDATWPAYWWRASLRGLGAVGGALFASGGLGALELSSSARAVMLLAIVWIAIGPVLADVILAYRVAPYANSERAHDGAVMLRAMLGAAAAGGLVLYGLAQLLPRVWWLTILPIVALSIAGCAYLLTHASRHAPARDLSTDALPPV